MKEQISEIVQSKDLREITLDLVEKVLDSQITDDLLREVPIVKSIVAVKNIYTSYSDRIFIKKAMAVLLELSEVTASDRQKLVEELSDEDQNGTEKILMAIDKLDSIRKCKVYGRLCKLRALGKISINGFLRLSKVIHDAYLDDLHQIIYLERNKKNDETGFVSFVHSKMMTLNSKFTFRWKWVLFFTLHYCENVHAIANSRAWMR